MSTKIDNGLNPKQGISAEETSRKISFCGHAIARPISLNSENRIMEIPDTLLDIRFKDNPLVLSTPNIRFYAGLVLQSHDDFNLGALCLIDTKPRKLSSADKASFFDLGMITQMLCNRYDMKIRTYIHNYIIDVVFYPLLNIYLNTANGKITCNHLLF